MNLRLVILGREIAAITTELEPTPPPQRRYRRPRKTANANSRNGKHDPTPRAVNSDSAGPTSPQSKNPNSAGKLKGTGG